MQGPAKKIGQEQMVADLNRDCTAEQKKILICYLDYLRTIRELNRNFGHTNRQEMMQILKVCIELNLRIDVCACYDRNAIEEIRENYYDYILGFGDTFFCAKEKNPDAAAILYTTENPYRISYERETERLRYFTERTGRTFHLERTGVYYKKDDEKKADRIICLGEPSYFADTGKPVVFCLLAGSDLNLKYAAEKFDAVMMLWYPGCQGGKAAARVLFGEISPSGKLPVTFYESLEELPDFTDYSMKGRTYRYMERKAQFPFGYGLTYSKVAVDKAEVKTCGQKINVEVEVQNNGAYDTEDVVQIYVKNIDSKNAIPNPMLAGFQRIFLKAGECRKIEIPIWEKAFTVVDETGKRMEEGKKFEIYAGCSQPDEKSKELTGIMPVKIIWEK